MTQTAWMFLAAFYMGLLVTVALCEKDYSAWKILIKFFISSSFFLLLFLFVVWCACHTGIGETLLVGQKKIIVIEKGFDFKEGMFFIVRDEVDGSLKLLCGDQILDIKNEMARVEKEREKEERKNEIIRKYLN